MTWGEAQEYVSVMEERRKRDAQTQSIIAFCHASAVSQMIMGDGEEISVMDIFPFWTEDERNEVRRQKYIDMMMSKVKGGGGHG